ncbi:hypothetical protein SESBI_41760 [Sesbania bispinosa]|nr:hypothetical protein SESBI_41760 [Sesbania bispinosa]
MGSSKGRKYRNSIRPNRVTGSGFWKATGIDKPIYCVKEPHECIGLKKSLVYYRGSAGKGTKTDWMMHEFRLPPNGKSNNNPQANDVQEAEVWTLCRILKRIPSYKKYAPNLKDSSSSSLVMTNKPNPLLAPTTLSYSSSFWNHQNVVDDHDNAFANENWDDLRSVVQFAIDPSKKLKNFTVLCLLSDCPHRLPRLCSSLSRHRHLCLRIVYGRVISLVLCGSPSFVPSFTVPALCGSSSLTLLLVEPLPQWQHPPPQLNSIEIPPVAISSPTPSPLSQDSNKLKPLFQQEKGSCPLFSH